MKRTSNILGTVVASTLIVSLMALAGCNKGGSTDTTQAASDASAASAAQPASAASAYTPPTAAQLEQMVAPIALFPDKLVAQVLAGATYPDQITAANQWLAQNPSLKGAALQNAANQQPWDVSVKSLTAFPAVLNQMAGNIQWTTALGEAYVNDPTDVMNAIQVMRQRAQQSGNLKSSKQLAVSSTARQAPPPDYQGEAGGPPVYAGPAVIPPPPQTIVIAPAQPDVVYVPTYDPNVVYGQPVPVYPGYVYHRPEYSTGEVVTAGVLTFGVGILVGDAISHHHDWGWHAWGMNWGGDRGPGGGYRGDGPGNGGNGGGWHRPAVVYNNNTYVSRSTTVVNHINNTTINNHYDTNRNVVNNTVVNNATRIDNHNEGRPNPGQIPGQAPGNEHRPPGPPPANPGAMTMPHFTQGDTREGARPAPQPGGNPHAEGRPGAEAQQHGNGEPGHPGQGQPHGPQPNFGGQMGQMGQMQHGQPQEHARPAGEAPRMEQQHEQQQQREQQAQQHQQQQREQQMQQHEQQQARQHEQQQAQQREQQAQQHAQQQAQQREQQMQQREQQQAQQREQPRPQPQQQHEQPRPQPQQHEQPHPQAHEQPHGGGEHHEH
ncbi:MAG: DUF3300 domain-containing protein [Burkholderia sp.]